MAVHDNSTATQQGGDTETDEFDAAVDDLIASRDEAPAQAAADEERDPTETDAATDTNEPGPAEGAGTDDQAAAPAPAQPSDIWANAPAELREARDREIQSLNHRLASVQGRQSAADRELARLRNERLAGSGGQQGESQGQQSQAPGQPANPFESDAVKRLREEYGEIAEPILGILQSQAEELAALRAPVADVVRDRADQATLSQVSVLAEAHPDWQAYTADPRYPEWVLTQPKAIQDAAARAVNLEDGQEAAWLLGQFKQSIDAAPSTPSPSPAPSRQQPPVRDPRRARQLAAGRDGGMTAPPTQSGIPDDFDAAVDAIEARRTARQAPRGQF